MKMDNNENNDTDKAPVDPSDSKSRKDLRRDQIAIEVILDHAPYLKINTTEEALIGLPLSSEAPSRNPENSTLSEKQEDEIRFSG